MRFFKAVLTGVAVLAAASVLAADWSDNFEKAKSQALEKKRPVLALFTGSDWCPWCVKLESEILSKTEFQNYASKNLVLFKADFPRSHKLSPGVALQNEKLSKQYGVEGFPTVLLLDGNGKVVGKTGYKKGGPEKYVESLKELLKNFSSPAAESSGDGSTNKSSAGNGGKAGGFPAQGGSAGGAGGPGGK